MIELMTTTMLVFARIAGLLRVLPIVSMSGTPKLFVLLTALAITLSLVPIVPISPVSNSMGLLLFGIGAELLFGLILGSIVNIIFGSMALAGEIMAGQMSYSMSTLFDPLMQSQDSTIGTICSWLAGLVFFGTGLHLTCISIVCESFQLIPPGTIANVFRGMEFFADAVASSILIAVKLSGPVLILVWTVQVFIAILTKMAPRMNIYFSVGITMINMSGLALLALSLPYIIRTHADAMVESTRIMVEAVRAML